jgi:hypothetical protein
LEDRGGGLVPGSGARGLVGNALLQKDDELKKRLREGGVFFGGNFHNFSSLLSPDDFVKYGR